ncbi:MAG: hypothetical protein IAE78_26230, partial [Myxococcus sp.]|nr:hypothetical protein [Myxococcus sp.]
MTTTIRRMGQNAAADRIITPDEAKAMVAQAQKNGIVSKTEKADLTRIMRDYKDLFQAGALDVIK